VRGPHAGCGSVVGSHSNNDCPAFSEVLWRTETIFESLPKFFAKYSGISLHYKHQNTLKHWNLVLWLSGYCDEIIAVSQNVLAVTNNVKR